MFLVSTFPMLVLALYYVFSKADLPHMVWPTFFSSMFQVFLWAPLVASAQGLPDGGLPDGTPVATLILDPSALSLLQQLLSLLQDPRAIGMAGGLASAIGIVVQITKLPAIDKMLGEDPRIRPFLSIFFGGILGALGAAACGAPLLGGVIAGIFAGLKATGAKEASAAFNVSKQAERNVGAAIVSALQGKDGDAATALASVQQQVAQAALIADEKARLAALADIWAKQGAAATPPAAPPSTPAGAP